jgi:hypothetical protein
LVRRAACFLPKPTRDLQGNYPSAFPPRAFITGLVQLSMMSTA